MSMILDALNRSRRESENGDVPTLDSQHYQTPRPPARAGLLAAVGALLMMVIVGIVLTTSGLSGHLDDAARLSGEAAAKARREEARAASMNGSMQPPGQPRLEAVHGEARLRAQVDLAQQQLAARRTRQTAEASMRVAELYAREHPSDAQKKLNDDEPATGLYELAGADGTLSDQVSNSDVEAPKPDSVTAMENSKDVPIDIAEVLRKVQRDLGQSDLSPHPVPALERLSQQVKDRIPTIVYSVHDYHQSGPSHVVLNGQRLTAGQRAKGFEVTEILSDSVILSWGGTAFRLRALNSWINL